MSTPTDRNLPPDPSKTEHALLTSYLLSRAPLPEFMPLSSFTALFPSRYRSNPQVRLLYRHLQLTRAAAISRVKKNIDLEVSQSTRQRQRRRLQQQSKTESAPSADAMVGVELFGANNSEPIMPLGELLAAMENALEDLVEEERRLESECDRKMNVMQEWVGGLSDLIYGKFSTQGIESKVVEQLENLTETCERVLEEE